uniref:Uncharacterized protein n=1 Tax=Anguilla anguilla TaxID=7936 RepID=A0A0E9QQL7_ANGAN
MTPLPKSLRAAGAAVWFFPSVNKQMSL